MRIQNSVAAAVAAAVSAVVFSAAFQPIQAAPILIDNFTTAIGGTTATGTTPASVNASISSSGSFGAFENRDSFGRLIQTAPRGSRTTSVGIFNSGTGTLLVNNSGAAGTGSITTDAETTYRLNDPSGAVNLTTGGNDAFQIKTGAVSNNLSSMSAYVWVADDVGAYYYTLPSKLFWNSFTTYTIPFTDFPGVDFTKVSYLGVGMSPQPDSTGSSESVAGNVAFSSSVTFTEISIVPEPTHLVLVGGVGAALGAWRLRKLRRNGEAAGDVIAS